MFDEKGRIKYSEIHKISDPQYEIDKAKNKEFNKINQLMKVHIYQATKSAQKTKTETPLEERGLKKGERCQTFLQRQLTAAFIKKSTDKLDFKKDDKTLRQLQANSARQIKDQLNNISDTLVSKMSNNKLKDPKTNAKNVNDQSFNVQNNNGRQESSGRRQQNQTLKNKENGKNDEKTFGLKNGRLEGDGDKNKGEIMELRVQDEEGDAAKHLKTPESGLFNQTFENQKASHRKKPTIPQANPTKIMVPVIKSAHVIPNLQKALSKDSNFLDEKQQSQQEMRNSDLNESLQSGKFGTSSLGSSESSKYLNKKSGATGPVDTDQQSSAKPMGTEWKPIQVEQSDIFDIIFNSANEANRPIKRSKPKIYQRDVINKNTVECAFQEQLPFDENSIPKNLERFHKSVRSQNQAAGGQIPPGKPPLQNKKELGPKNQRTRGKRFAIDFTKLTPVRQSKMPGIGSGGSGSQRRVQKVYSKSFRHLKDKQLSLQLSEDSRTNSFNNIAISNQATQAVLTSSTPTSKILTPQLPYAGNKASLQRQVPNQRTDSQLSMAEVLGAPGAQGAGQSEKSGQDKLVALQFIKEPSECNLVISTSSKSMNKNTSGNQDGVQGHADRFDDVKPFISHNTTSQEITEGNQGEKEDKMALDHPQPARIEQNPHQINQEHLQELLSSFKSIRDIKNFFNYPQQPNQKREWQDFVPTRDRSFLIDPRQFSADSLLPFIDVARLDSDTKLLSTTNIYESSHNYFLEQQLQRQQQSTSILKNRLNPKYFRSVDSREIAVQQQVRGSVRSQKHDGLKGNAGAGGKKPCGQQNPKTKVVTFKGVKMSSDTQQNHNEDLSLQKALKPQNPKNLLFGYAKIREERRLQRMIQLSQRIKQDAMRRVSAPATLGENIMVLGADHEHVSEDCTQWGEAAREVGSETPFEIDPFPSSYRPCPQLDQGTHPHEPVIEESAENIFSGEQQVEEMREPSGEQSMGGLESAPHGQVRGLDQEAEMMDTAQARSVYYKQNHDVVAHEIDLGTQPVQSPEYFEPRKVTQLQKFQRLQMGAAPDKDLKLFDRSRSVSDQRHKLRHGGFSRTRDVTGGGSGSGTRFTALRKQWTHLQIQNDVDNPQLIGAVADSMSFSTQNNNNGVFDSNQLSQVNQRRMNRNIPSVYSPVLKNYQAARYQYQQNQQSTRRLRKQVVTGGGQYSGEEREGVQDQYMMFSNSGVRYDRPQNQMMDISQNNFQSPNPKQSLPYYTNRLNFNAFSDDLDSNGQSNFISSHAEHYRVINELSAVFAPIDEPLHFQEGGSKQEGKSEEVDPIRSDVDLFDGLEMATDQRDSQLMSRNPTDSEKNIFWDNQFTEPLIQSAYSGTQSLSMMSYRLKVEKVKNQGGQAAEEINQ